MDVRHVTGEGRMKIDKLQPGQIVYDVGRVKMGNTTISTVAVWNVRIVSVDVDAGTVVASWNSNPERKYYGREIRRWRAKRPVLVRSGLGYRLAKRGEVAAKHSDSVETE
jgi:hypothetical protein